MVSLNCANRGLTLHLPCLTNIVVGPAQFSSDDELHANETEQLLQAFPVLGNGNPPVLMGDFNHGLRDDDAELDDKFPASHQMIYDAGYTSPYVSEVGVCSLCRGNDLRGSNKEQTIIDHIYVGNETSVQGVKVRHN